MAQASGGTVDFAYLERFAAGDRAVIVEVLALFAQQAGEWSARLAAPSDDWRDVVHTIKGAARGVGAFRLGDLCAEAEAAGPSGLPAVREALAGALAEMAAYRGA
jgi:HPt (histidine-containing phosphotransfer) domain-containing protein